MQVDTFWMPKSGHSADEYEDAFWTSDHAASPFRAAVADGATESAFSGGWARALVTAYVSHGDLARAVASARSHFAPPADARWYVQAKVAQGAHAALLGIEIDGERWRAEAVGDCCLVHARSGAVWESWPLTHPDEFDHRPALISSRTEPDTVNSRQGCWRRGDVLVLASDALAEWLLRGGFAAFLEAADRAAVIRAARSESSLRNDDLTAIIIQPNTP